MKLNSTMKIAIAVISAGMLITPVAMAQQMDEATKLEQMANKLRAATVASTVAKRKDAASINKQKPKDKKKVATKQKKVTGRLKGVAVQQEIEVKQESSVVAKPGSQAVSDVDSVRVKAQALARAALQAQSAAQMLAGSRSPVVRPPPFNRTMRLPETYNLPPSEDGAHDPSNEEGIKALHTPVESFADLPRRNTGNRVDWVLALNEKKIAPRWDRTDAQAEGMLMDMDIVRVPKGTMPNVVFPHKQHTEWLACANCHPAIFVPQKGANIINMRIILSGEKCGVCHGKVAFPPSECRLCHSQKKDVLQGMSDTP